MAQSESKMGLGLVFFAMLFALSSAQLNCVPAITGLSSCISYFVGNSSSPTSECCSQLSNLMQSQEPCYCTIVNGGATSALGFILNQTQAISLPTICNLHPLTQCDALGTPIPATPSPSSAPPPALSTPSTPNVTSPSTSPLPSGTGLKTTPTIVQSSAARSCTTFAPALLFFLLFLAS
ncbi:non-specific lipid transfer protein GPI-anchored 5-like [Typha angustifolia]|uniref:non-specific lipid transfer protein GPI-anchored 5-like n=1 Tax=Typha angustifolia TaxID=59011 RepID=UPI003C2FDC98